MYTATHQELLQEKARRLMLFKARHGGLPGCAPVGYINKRRGKETWVEEDPEKSWLIKLAFELACEGKLSLRANAQTLNDLGLLSRNGKPLGVSALWSILTNPFYTGQMIYRREVLKGNHPALVSVDEWKTVQEKLQARRRRFGE